MGLFDFFRRTVSTNNKQTLKTHWTSEGVQIEFTHPLSVATLEAFLEAIHLAGPEDSVLGAYLAQLVIEGPCLLNTQGVQIVWPEVYKLLSSSEHQGAVQLLGLPEVGTFRPILTCTGTISDSEFELEIMGWTDGDEQIHPELIEGAVITVAGSQRLLSESSWATLTEIAAFQQRGIEQRTQHDQELAWGRIRGHADQAGALYASRYLETTYILTPQFLRFPLSRDDTPFGRVLTVAPTFAGAPDGWLTAFDGFNSVQPHYDLTRGSGRMRVVISDPVRQVLSVIKREMPGRRIAGARAEKFIHNPWAFLGDAAHDVLREDDFQADKDGAGSVTTGFNIVSRFENGRINRVDLCITEYFADGSAQTDTKSFSEPDQLETFVSTLKSALEQDRERFPWYEYDLSLDAESVTQFAKGQQLVQLWRTQPAERISFEDIYELDGYSGRIEGIGAARPIYVPVFQKSTDDAVDEPGWLPSDLTPTIRVIPPGMAGGQVLLPLTLQWVKDFDKQVGDAEQSGQTEVINSSLPTPIATDQARKLVNSFISMLDAQNCIKRDVEGKLKGKRPAREMLLVKTNFHDVDYLEVRRESLVLPADWKAKLPRCLRSDIKLKDHQLYGVAWFQHLVSKAPVECRGALLADDMGLGKTLQILSVLGWYYETNPNAVPSVIFAPKSLLDNWVREAEKFFTPSFPELLVLYGDELRSRKQPLALIDSQLQSKGIVELLQPGWVGIAKVIITTYETLTAFEFSFAKQPFAFVICDEAQRIKTPGTLVTLAAKKLKADFRVACTGTPVENSLADLWCLFDFVQPGLLGALEEFGKNYRRPIECQTEEQRQALVRLQSTISPQTLRRTKASIASLLPKKYFAVKAVTDNELHFKPLLGEQDRLEIAISEYQRVIYKGGLKKLLEAAEESDSRKRAWMSFGVLHLMRAVCAEPYCLPGTKFLVDKAGRVQHFANSPKLRWLLEHLEVIRRAGEKAIIFTELRETQAALYYFLREIFGLKPFIINGNSQGRQAYIDKFSAHDGFDVIILSTLAAGAGLNVTAANHVFHFTRTWNPAKESQATDRAYRLGQGRDVYVYCPTVVADDFKTFEVRLDQLLKKKASLADLALNDGELVSMLNGTGGNITFTELVGDGRLGEGESTPKRYLTLDDVDRMDGVGFEVFCCLLWTKKGFVSNLTPKHGGDGGIDVVAFLNNGREGELLQCKSSIRSTVGWDAIKEVTAGAALYQKRFAKTRFRRVAVTNQEFTSGAVIQAEANRVELVTRQRLAEYLGIHPISNYEFDEALQEYILKGI